MRRTLTIIVLAGFLVATGIYLFIYLFRAYRLPEPAAETTVYIWHGDPMIRAVLLAILFLIGLVLLLFVSVLSTSSRRPGSVRVRPDLWAWVSDRAEDTNEDPARIVERAIAQLRSDVEGRSHVM